MLWSLNNEWVSTIVQCITFNCIFVATCNFNELVRSIIPYPCRVSKTSRHDVDGNTNPARLVLQSHGHINVERHAAGGVGNFVVQLLDPVKLSHVQVF